MISSIAIAIHDAVGAWVREWPFTTERVLRAMGSARGILPSIAYRSLSGIEFRLAAPAWNHSSRSASERVENGAETGPRPFVVVDDFGLGLETQAQNGNYCLQSTCE